MRDMVKDCVEGSLIGIGLMLVALIFIAVRAVDRSGR